MAEGARGRRSQRCDPPRDVSARFLVQPTVSVGMRLLAVRERHESSQVRRTPVDDANEPLEGACEA